MTPQIEESFYDATSWRDEAIKLREILLGCGLTEERKWGKPCYSYDGGNIAIIQRMKTSLALLFFKGALLKDPDGILEFPGPNSRVGRRALFTGLDDVRRLENSIRAYVREAIELEKAGLSVPKEKDDSLPEELTNKLADDPEMKAAFEALTPGRQRGYSLYFAAPKQSKTRVARIEKYRSKILAGKGFHDR